VRVSPKDPSEKVAASNRRASHDYDILERIEAGIRLTGSEVKSLRGGRASLAEAFARIRDGEAWLEGMHIPPYEQGQTKGYDPIRPRKLLLHRREIDRLLEQQQKGGYALIPLSLYFKDGRVKVEIGVAKGKREADKRDAIAEKEAKREMDRARRR
jgi:SsrA-binding protein